MRTPDKEIARRLFNAKNEAHQQPGINLQIARTYLMASELALLMDDEATVRQLTQAALQN